MRLSPLALALCCAVAGAQKAPPAGGAADKLVTLEATLLDKAALVRVLGSDPGENVIVLEVAVTPAAGKPLKLTHDDFLLRSDRDGQRSQPLHPAQVAGATSLVISSRGGTQGTAMAEERGPVFGAPGLGGIGRLPGQGVESGVATADTSSADASLEERGARGKKNPLLDAMKAKLLAEGELTAPARGLLYFGLEGKHRPKDLEIVYRRSPPRLSIRFKEPK
jgi:hypothetical protein